MLAVELNAPDADLAGIEARLRRWRMLYIVAATLAGGWRGGGWAAGAVLAGSALSLSHLHWIEREVDRRLLGRRAKGRRGRYLPRLLLFAAIVYVIFRFHWLPLAALLVGLFTPAAAICMEGLWQLTAYFGQATGLRAKWPPRTSA